MYCLNEQNVEHFNDTAHYLLLMHQNNRKTLKEATGQKKNVRDLKQKKKKKKERKAQTKQEKPLHFKGRKGIKELKLWTKFLLL